MFILAPVLCSFSEPLSEHTLIMGGSVCTKVGVFCCCLLVFCECVSVDIAPSSRDQRGVWLLRRCRCCWPFGSVPKTCSRPFRPFRTTPEGVNCRFSIHVTPNTLEFSTQAAPRPRKKVMPRLLHRYLQYVIHCLKRISCRPEFYFRPRLN